DQILEVGDRQVRDPAALTRGDVDQPLVGQALDGLAQRRAADAELLHQGTLVEHLAGRELAGQDHVLEHAVRLVGLARLGRAGPIWRWRRAEAHAPQTG